MRKKRINRERRRGGSVQWFRGSPGRYPKWLNSKFEYRQKLIHFNILFNNGWPKFNSNNYWKYHTLNREITILYQFHGQKWNIKILIHYIICWIESRQKWLIWIIYNHILNKYFQYLIKPPLFCLFILFIWPVLIIPWHLNWIIDWIELPAIFLIE